MTSPLIPLHPSTSTGERKRKIFRDVILKPGSDFFTMNSYSHIICAATETNPEIMVDALKIKKTAIVVRALNHKLRLVILKLIGERDNITVTEIFQHLHLEQCVASQHLAVLRKTGFVKTKREGKFIYYSINRQRLLELNMFVEELLK